MTQIDPRVADPLITDDLAALGADSRRRVLPIEPMLRAAVRAHAAPAGDRGALALAGLVRVLSARIAGAVAGGIAIATTCALILVLQHPGASSGIGPAWWVWPVHRNTLSVAALTAALVLGGHAVAAAIAARHIEQRFRARAAAVDPAALGELGRQLDRRTRGWLVGLVPAGVTSATALLGIAFATAGRSEWTVFWLVPFDATSAAYLREIALLVAGALIAALALGRAAARLGPRSLRRLEVAAAVAAIALGLGAHALVRTEHDPGAPYTAAAIAISLCVFLTTTWLTLRVCRRGQPTIATGAAIAVDPRALELAALAAVFRQRVARLAAGSVALAATLAFELIAHRALHHGIGPVHGAARHWRFWLFHEYATIPALIAAAMLTAYLVAARAADRAFRARLQRGALDSAGTDRAIATGRALVARVDGWSLAVGISGLAVFKIALGIATLTAGGGISSFLQNHGPRVARVVHQALREISIAAPACLLIAAALGLACLRESTSARARRALAIIEHGAVAPVAAALVAITCFWWAQLDFGVDDVSAVAIHLPPLALRVGLTAALTAAIVLVTASLAARCRRREQARLHQ